VCQFTRGPGRFLPSDSAPFLQYGSGPSSDFLAKILGVDTTPFPWNTGFYFAVSSLFRCCLARRYNRLLRAMLQLVLRMFAAQPTRVLVHCRFFFFLITMYIMALDDFKFNLFSNLCVYFLSLYIFEDDRSAVGFSACHGHSWILLSAII
jgi:hypothetical protein